MAASSRVLSPAALIGGSAFDCREEHPFRHALHRHETFSELLFIEEGEGTFVVDGKSYEAGPGTILLYHRGIWHEEQSSHYPFRAVYFAFKGLQVKGCPPDYFLDPTQVPAIDLGEKAGEIGGLMRECLAELHSGETESLTAANHLFGLLLARLARRAAGEATDRRLVKPAEAAVIKARSYIEQNYQQPITLESLAKVTFVSKYYLSHLFQQEVGMPVIRYLIRCRIEAAKRYLIMTDRPVKEIGEIVGYQSEPTFYHLFKKVTGLTPGQFRMSERENKKYFMQLTKVNWLGK